MSNMLEILRRLKNVKNLDAHHTTLVENAYYLCKPPERSSRVSKVRPPLHQYIRRLLFSDLDKTSVQHILLQLLKLPWAECEQYIVKCFLKVHKGKYSQVHLIALLTAGLSRYHDDFAVVVVDEVLEEIRVGLELNDYAMQQQRLAHMRFLGELYNYECIDSSVIFETLNLIIVFGHGTSEQDLLDPLEDFFRIRLVITLLQTCGHYFTRGSSKRKLDSFLLLFQRYALGKGPLPLDVEFDVQDMFAELRPNMRHSSLEGLNNALVELEQNEHVAAARKGGDESHWDSKSQSKQSENVVFDANDKMIANISNKNGRDHEEAPNGENSTDSTSRYRNGHEDEEDFLREERLDDRLENEDRIEDITVPVGSDEEETVEVRKKKVQVDPKDQEDFDRELKAILLESLESRKLEPARPTVNMKEPMSTFKGSKDLMTTEAADKENVCDELVKSGSGGASVVCFKVLVKKGHKQQTKQMLIPGDCPLVQSTKQQSAAELEEKQNIKRKILEYNEREEELNATSQGSGNGGQGGRTDETPADRVTWVGPSRGGVRQHYWVAGGFYRGYGRK